MSEVIINSTNKQLIVNESNLKLVKVYAGRPGIDGVDGKDASGSFTATAEYLSGAIDLNSTNIDALSAAIDNIPTADTELRSEVATISADHESRISAIESDYVVSSDITGFISETVVSDISADLQSQIDAINPSISAYDVIYDPATDADWGFSSVPSDVGTALDNLAAEVNGLPGPGPTTYDGLTDTPSDKIGADGKFVKVSGISHVYSDISGSEIIYVPSTIGDWGFAAGTPSDVADALDDVAAEITSLAGSSIVTFDGLTDTPANKSGSDGYAVVVSGATLVYSNAFQTQIDELSASATDFSDLIGGTDIEVVVDGASATINHSDIPFAPGAPPSGDGPVVLDAIGVSNRGHVTNTSFIRLGTSAELPSGAFAPSGDYALNSTVNTISGDLDSLESDVATISADVIQNTTDITSVSGDVIILRSHVDIISGDLDVVEEIFRDVVEPTGFVNTNETSTISVDSINRIVTLTPGSEGVEVYLRGTKYTYTDPITAGFDDLEGNHFFVIDLSGNFVANHFSDFATTDDIIQHIIIDNAFVAEIYWDATNDKALLLDERHGCVMDSATHYNLHISEGTRYVSGLTVGGIDADQNGSLDSHAQFSSLEGIILDEDVSSTIAAKALSGDISVLYQEGATGTWRWADSSAPVITAGTGRAAYNLNTGGTWSLQEVGNNNFVLAHIFATPRLNGPGVIAFMGQNQYSTISTARVGAAEEIGNLITQGLAIPEFVPMATIIYQTANTMGNTWKATIRTTDEGDDYVNWLGTRNFTSAGAATTHNALAGLQGGSVGEYFHLTSAEYSDLIGRTEVAAVSADLAGDIATNAANITNKRTGFVAAVGYDFNGEDFASSWTGSAATFVDSVSGAIYTASGADSYIFRGLSNVDLYANPIFRLHYNNNSGSSTSCQLYVNTGSGLTLVTPFSISSVSGWKTLELDLTNNATWKGTANQIRLDLDQGGSFGNPLLIGGVSVGHTADETRTSVEGLVGAVDLSGAGSVSVSTNGQTIIISGGQSGGSGATSASQLIYDQSSTGLGSNVQDAIDSLNTNISTVVKTFGYTFSTTTTDSDPGNGFLRVNSATPSAATMIFIDPIDGNSNDQSSNINKLTFGNEVVIDDGTNSYTYSVNGPIVNVTGYIKIPVGGATISGTISNSASVTFRITYSATNINVAGGIGVVTNSTSTTSIPVGGGQIVYSNVLWQNASDYNATTGIYTIPYDGLYRFNAQYRLNNVTTNLRSACYARVNGSDLIRTEWVTSQYVTPLCHGVLNLTAGDQVIVWGFYSGGSANIFTTFNSQDNLFSIMKVG